MLGTEGRAKTDGAAICIDRAVTIEAQVPGSVVLDAGSAVRQTFTHTWQGDGDREVAFLEGGLRVVLVNSGGTARLIGLNITGGYASVRSVALLNTCVELTLELTGVCARALVVASQLQDGAGLYISEGGTATLIDVNVYSNIADNVCFPCCPRVDMSLHSPP